jgi:hypothetical protein
MFSQYDPGIFYLRQSCGMHGPGKIVPGLACSRSAGSAGVHMHDQDHVSEMRRFAMRGLPCAELVDA